MATAKQLPSGSWRCQVYAGTAPDGKRQYRSFTAYTKKEAEYAALERQSAELKQGSASFPILRFRFSQLR